jgi:hypothetical protein
VYLSDKDLSGSGTPPLHVCRQGLSPVTANVANLAFDVPFSGTVGAASAASNQLGIPGIAFSGTTGSQTAWDVSPKPDYAAIYAELARTLVDALLELGTRPYLPQGTFLNVNFPAAGSGTACTDPGDFKFVLSRIYTAIPILTPPDVVTCNNKGRLPAETSVVETEGCYCSISVGIAKSKTDADAIRQEAVLQSLESFLSCLP